MTESPKSEFIELFANIQKAKGIDDLTSHIMGILFIEPEELSLEEIASRTGYSLSAVSTSMKSLSNFPMVKRVKKPGSRKIYFYMEKNLSESMHQGIKTAMGNIVLMKEKLPALIERYKTEKGSFKERKIIESHYIMVKEMECIMNKLTEMIKDAHKKCEIKKS